MSIEKDAARTFRSAPGLEWLADAPPTSLETFNRLISARSVWMAEADGLPCGFVAARTEEDGLYIVELSVRRDHQGRGLGRKLVQAVVEEARRLGLPGVTLTTFRAVPWNEPFYARLGFVRLEEHELSLRLRIELEREAGIGLPIERRCAMRLAFS